VQNFLRKNTKTAKRSGKQLKKFHRLLRRVAKQFQDAHDLGMQSKSTNPKPPPRNTGKGRHAKAEEGDDNEQSSTADEKKRKKAEKRKAQKAAKIKVKGIKCVKCGGPHWPKNCKATKEEVTKWQNSAAGKALADKLEKARKTKPPRGENSSEPDNGNPGGGKKTALRKRPDAATSKAKVSAETIGADGAATVNGVSGWYSCDGGCDKATIGCAFAEVLQKKGTELIKYPEPLHATLIDGSSGPSVTHYCVADVVLTTKAGNVVLPRTHIDVLASGA